jgi:chemotaxis protein methyltransferase CheR
MMTPVENILKTVRLSTSEFEKLAKIVYEQCGIKLEHCKKVMLESRLNKRLRTLNINSFERYIQYIGSKEGIENEIIHMIDVVTTNKTDFFREPHHFDFLKNELLPAFLENNENKTFRVWSAACSTGEEPYTLAMVLQQFAKTNLRFNYRIIASDISTQVLQKATDAVYPLERAADIPAYFKKDYLLKSKDAVNPRVRIIPQLREKVEFKRVNLMDDTWEIEGNLDVIFCRNVLIYFDRDTQQQVVKSLVQKLRPGGILFIGHSESLHFFELPVRQIRPTIFIKQ